MHPSNDERAARRRLLQLAGVGAAVSLTGAPAITMAQTDRPLKFIVPFPPGTGTDLAARLFAKVITEKTARATVVENKPGGNGVIAVQAALAAPPDGNTIFVGANSTLSTNAAAFKRLPYDPVGDFSLLSFLVIVPCFVIVPPGSPYTSVQQLLADARRRPKALNYGAGSVTYQLILEWLNELARTQSTCIMFKGSTEARVAVMGATVDYAITDASEDVAALARAGKLRVLLHTAEQRSPLLPDVPSSVDAGLPEFVALTWAAAAVSSKTPAAITEGLRHLFAEVAKSPEVKDYYTRRSMPQLALAGAELQKYQRDEIQRWQRLVAAIGFERE